MGDCDQDGIRNKMCYQGFGRRLLTVQKKIRREEVQFIRIKKVTNYYSVKSPLIRCTKNTHSLYYMYNN